MAKWQKKKALILDTLVDKPLILGVDPSLIDSGLCLLKETEILNTSHVPTKSYMEMSKRLEKIYVQFEEFFEQSQADYVAVEDQFLGSFYTAKSYGVQERKNLKTIQGLSYVKGIVLVLAGKFDIPVIQINVSQWRTRYLPRRNMTKSEIMKFINNTFQQNITNNNISDAILIGLCGQALLQEQRLHEQVSTPSNSSTNQLTKRPRV